ncbi:MAG: MFS transporter [Gulosibacter sp.]|uniref:MFS transporter n=1 Tax=Gulosibacter sp. TaxID=2817531 RepID=UPI003F8F9DB3
MSKNGRLRLPRPAAFIAATLALIGCFFASGVPVPLYNIFRVEDGITDADLALTTVMYLLVTALSLLVLGRLSNHLGRRAVVIGALVFAVAGCVVLTQVHSLPVLILGRVLQGIACGMASAAAGAMVVDLAPRTRLRWLPAVVTSSAPPFAIPVGAISSSLLVEFAAAPRILSLSITAGVLLLLIPLVVLAPETVYRRPGALRSLIPRVEIPEGSGRAIITAGGAILASWSWGGFYQSFAPGLTSDYLGTSSALMIAIVFSSYTLLAPIGGSISTRFPTTPALRTTLVLFVIVTGFIVVTLHAGAIVPFLIVSVLAGFFNGAANSSGMQGVFVHVKPEQRAGTLATLYLISYSSAALPGLFAGELSRSMALPDLATVYVGISIVGTAIAFIGSRRPKSA